MDPSPKRVCLVTLGYPPRDWGGLARTTARVAGHLKGLGLEVQVAELLIQDKGLVLLDENVETETVDGITLHRIKAGRERFGYRDRTLWDCPHTYTLRMWHQSLTLLQEKEKYDLLGGLFLYPLGYLSVLAAHQAGIPALVGLMGNDIKKYLFSPEKVGPCRTGLEGADWVVSLSREMIDLADAVVPVKYKSSLVYNSVEIPERAWEQKRQDDRPFRFGFAGSFKYAKGLPYLFKALALLRKSHQVELELAGEIRDAERSVFETMKDRTGVGDLIRFKGAVDHREMADWLLSLDGFVLPSVSEGCPNILLEAMACGLPCAATRTGATPDMIEDKVSGYLVRPGDSQDLAKAMWNIMDRPARAAEMGAAARKRAGQRFNPLAEKEGWEEVVRSLIEF